MPNQREGEDMKSSRLHDLVNHVIQIACGIAIVVLLALLAIPV